MRLFTDMDSDFSIIGDFLERCFPEVEGRALPTPGPELAKKLEHFARGECTPEVRVEICNLLREEPQYLRVLAHRVKDLRNAPETEVAG